MRAGVSIENSPAEQLTLLLNLHSQSTAATSQAVLDFTRSNNRSIQRCASTVDTNDQNQRILFSDVNIGESKEIRHECGGGAHCVC